MQNAVSRRSFVAGAATAAGVASVAGASLASAEAAELSDTCERAVPAWLGEKSIIDEADVIEEVDCDVLVCGAGHSGTFCACFAQAGGADVLWVEARDRGVGMRSSAISGINTKYQEAVGVSINPEAILNDVVRVAHNVCNINHWRDWVDHSCESVAWYGEMAERSGQYLWVESNVPQDTPYPCWPTGHGLAGVPESERQTDPFADGNARGNETALWDTAYEDFVSNGGTLRNNTRLVELIQDENGAVIGAYCEIEGGYLRANAAKGVVIATGGYVNNEEMFKDRQGDFWKSCTGNLNFGAAKGDGIKACLWAGADIDKQAANSTFDRGVVRPDYPTGGMFSGGDYQLFTFATQPFLKVNCKGRRITNESSLYDSIIHAANKYPNYAWYPIWDSSWTDDVQRFMTIGCSTLFCREGSNQHAPGLDAVAAQMDELVADGYIVKADTLEELAEGLGFDTDTFLAEVEKYNGWAERGYDGEFGKDPFRLSFIDEPPFYGMKFGGLPLNTMDGIITDDECRALTPEGEVVEGLYVAGNDCGCNHLDSYPNQGAGTCCGRSAVNGMLVGKTLAAK